MEIAALRGRGWSVSAIARHTGRDRKTIRAYLAGQAARRRGRAASVLEPYRAYLAARFGDDPHVLGSVLFREIVDLGFDRSYQTFTRELRVLGLRPVCECCRRGGVEVTIEIDHPPGEEMQFDWLELHETPWGVPAFVLVGALCYSASVRGVFSEGQTGPHVIEGLDGVLRRHGGTTRRWRTDRMAGVVYPGSDRLLPEFVACAKHYGVGVDVCPARRAKRKGAVEAAIKYLTRSWWCSASVATPAQAQESLDRFCVQFGDQRRRRGSTVAALTGQERLLELPNAPFPAEICVEREASRSALVSFEGNQYSVPATFAGAQVTVRARLGEQTVQILSAAGSEIATHRRVSAGAGQRVRSAEHAAGLREAVLAAFTTRPPCTRKQNRPPGQAALMAAAALRGEPTGAQDDGDGGGVVIDLERYAQLAEVAR